jgi:3'-phosphoadenosine 5'-phosphosulfate (PAPS) 3'-phosphatase
MEVPLHELLSVCLDASHHAAESIRTHHSKHKNVDYKLKSVDNPVTEADLESEGLIRNYLISKWPNLAIVGEESVKASTKVVTSNSNLISTTMRNVNISQIIIFIDPLDGTVFFFFFFKYCYLRVVMFRVF